MRKKIGLHWFRKDLRLKDNPSLSSLASHVDELVCVYLLDEVTVLEHSVSPSNKELLGEHRANFIHQTLIDLDISLQRFGQQLIVLGNSSLKPLLNVIDSLGITDVSAEWHCGFNEQNQWCELISLRPQLSFIQKNGSTLFEESQFPFSIENLPASFSPFRKKVEKYCQVEVLDEPIKTMPASNISDLSFDSIEIKSLSTSESHYAALAGGETKALEQLKYYFWDTDLITTYKETRNGLDGWEFSSKFSAWLAQGCISHKRIYHELSQYEAERTKNESTYWLFFELLWREFFHWNHFAHKATLFSRSGVQGVAKASSFDLKTMQSWQQGNTGYPIVDACMRQLLATGFMSNRGRQLVASCFVHELGQDWRYGACYFEFQLVDFDVASNWGNWQYLAGVGADSRGHRQFNLVKQTQIYDPDQTFITHWLA
jgi:deoxyribodipyrimidine photo-lyase